MFLAVLAKEGNVQILELNSRVLEHERAEPTIGTRASDRLVFADNLRVFPIVANIAEGSRPTIE